MMIYLSYEIIQFKLFDFSVIIIMRPYLAYHPLDYTGIGTHRHAELAAIERSRVLWEESLRLNQRQALDEVERDRELLLYAKEREAYEREVRLQRMIEYSKEQSYREMEQLRRRVLQEQVEYQDHLRKMDLEKAYHRRSDLLRSEQKAHQSFMEGEAARVRTQKKKGALQEGIVRNVKGKVEAESTFRNDLNRFSGSSEGELNNTFKQRDSNPKTASHYLSEKATASNKIEYEERDQDAKERVKQSNVSEKRGRRYSILKETSRKKIFTFSKEGKRVQFDESRSKSAKRSFRVSPRKSQLLNISEHGLKGDPSHDAHQRILNRLRHSEVVYKDSQFRNIKHEMDHLLNTYDNERKIRNSIRSKINNYPPIIDRQGLVVEGS